MSCSLEYHCNTSPDDASKEVVASTSSTQGVASRVTTPVLRRKVSSGVSLTPAEPMLLLFTVSGPTPWSDSGTGGPSGSQNGGRVLVNSAPGRYLWKTWIEDVIWWPVEGEGMLAFGPLPNLEGFRGEWTATCETGAGWPARFTATPNNFRRSESRTNFRVQVTRLCLSGFG